MSTHTPGPWFLPRENAGSLATSVWARGGDVRVADCNSGAISLSGRQCDARLIAAAPDLLACLQEAVGDIESKYGDFLTRARASIASATGVSTS